MKYWYPIKAPRKALKIIDLTFLEPMTVNALSIDLLESLTNYKTSLE